MRVAIVAGPYVAIPPKQYGGIEQVIYYLIEGLKEAGHEPILLAPGDSTIDCRVIPIVPKALGFPRHKKDLPAHEKLVARANRNTARELKKLMPEIDIIHSHGFDMTKFSDFPHVITLHNKIGIEDLDYYVKRKFLNYVSISKNQQQVLPELNYYDVVYNGEDPSAFPVVEKPESYLCFLGRFDRDKNPHLAIQLALNLKMKIKLAGKIDHQGDGYFETEIEPHLKNPLVEYLGELGFEDKINLLSNAACNLHPTNFREPFGLTVLEAAYCGTPTLAVARGSMPELIEPERTGMLCEDFAEGRHMIQQCLELDRAYIASRSRQLFNYQNMAKHYVDVYQRIIEDYASRPVGRKSLISRLIGRGWNLIDRSKLSYGNTR